KVPPFGPWVSGSCDNRTVSITLQSAVGIRPDWRLQSHTSVTQLDAADRCKVTFLKIDVTDRILAKVRGVLDNAAAQVDERVARYSIQSQVGKGWALIQHSYQVLEGIWLRVNPNQVFLGSLQGADKTLTVTVGILGRPEMLFAEPEEQAP